MPWQSITGFSNHMKGKFVRFKTSVATPNLSNQLISNKTFGPMLQIPAGAIGVIYEARLGTWFIGFGRDLKSAPSKHTSPTFYAATVQLTVDSCMKLEVES